MEQIVELMLAIRDFRFVYYHKDTNTFDFCPRSSIELEHSIPGKLIPIHDTNNFRLPTYQEIDHKEIFSFFVRECIYEKEIRKQLFNILRRNEYIDAFIDKLHELNLYDDFVDICGDIYYQIFMEWQDENGLKLISHNKHEI